MSILNRPSDGLHNVLIVLFKCLLMEGAMPKDKLLSLCAPETLTDGDMARKTLTRWTQLGLFQESDDRVAISPDLPREARNRERALLELPQTVRRLVLSASNNERFWEAEDNRSADFTRAACWMFMQDAYETQFAGYREPADREIEQVRDSTYRLFQNDTRWLGFKAWAPFLGFGWIAKFPKNETFVCDPTVAIGDALPEVFGDTKELDHKAFFARLADAVPVLDAGQYRREVESRIDTRVWRPPQSDEISTSLSRALERLHAAGVLRMESRADADKRKLLGQGRIHGRIVSHVLWSGGKR